jgi:hypothetical protein
VSITYRVRAYTNISQDKILLASPSSVPLITIGDGVPQNLSGAVDPLYSDVRVVSSNVLNIRNTRTEDHTGYVLLQMAPIMLTAIRSDTLRDINSEITPSTQPSTAFISGITKTQNSKKSKKGGKTFLRQQRGVPWPPRPSGVLSKVVEPSLSDEITSGKLSHTHIAGTPTETGEDRAGRFFERDVHNSEQGQHSRDQAQNHAIHSHQEANTGDTKPESHTVDEVSSAGQRTADNVRKAPPQHGPRKILETLLDSLPDNSSLLLERKNIDDPSSHTYSEVASRAPKGMKSQERPVASRANARYASLHQPRHTKYYGQEVATVESHSSQATKAPTHRGLQHHKQADAILHHVSSQKVTHRVEKPQKNKRAVDDPPSLTTPVLVPSRGPDMHSGFEQTLERLREAYCTEQHQKDHDIATQTKHFEEIKANLQDQINQYSVIITKWKDKHDALNMKVLQLQERAKINQKYVSGLQRDHEKLQNSASAFQDECKRTLQQKIAEVESEKKSLQRELEKTLDTLVKGQRTLKGTVNDLYERLTTSDIRRKHLAEDLNKQVTMYEEEKSKRIDLETQMLSSFQSVQRLLGDCSTQLLEKFESLQSSVESSVLANEKQSIVQECFATLQKLQDTPSLAIKDIKKAEGMLRFMYDK